MKSYEELRSSAAATFRVGVTTGAPLKLNIGEREEGWSAGTPFRHLPRNPWECAAFMYDHHNKMNGPCVRDVAKLLKRRGVGRPYKVARVARRNYLHALPGWNAAATDRAESRERNRATLLLDFVARVSGWRNPPALLDDRLDYARRRGGVAAIKAKHGGDPDFPTPIFTGLERSLATMEDTRRRIEGVV